MTDETYGWQPEIERATEFVRPLLTNKDGRQPDDVDIVLWGTAEYQPRVAEVSYYFVDQRRGRPFGGGASWMQVDATCFPVVMGVERLLLAYRVNDTDGFPDDMIEEAEDNLRFALEDR